MAAAAPAPPAAAPLSAAAPLAAAAAPDAGLRRLPLSAFDELERELRCPICLELLQAPLALGCGHSFCRDCLSLALSLKPECPSCREPATRRSAADNHLLRLLAHELTRLRPLLLAAAAPPPPPSAWWARESAAAPPPCLRCAAPMLRASSAEAGLVCDGGCALPLAAAARRWSCAGCDVDVCAACCARLRAARRAPAAPPAARRLPAAALEQIGRLREEIVRSEARVEEARRRLQAHAAAARAEEEHAAAPPEDGGAAGEEEAGGRTPLGGVCTRSSHLSSRGSESRAAYSACQPSPSAACHSSRSAASAAPTRIKPRHGKRGRGSHSGKEGVPPPSSHSAWGAAEGEGGATEDGGVCCVCRQAEDEPTDQLLTCADCELSIHKHCHGGVRQLPASGWRCERCAAEQASPGGWRPRACAFCPSSKGAFKRTHRGQWGGWAHMVCTQFYSHTRFADAQNLSDATGFDSEAMGAFKRLKCSLCPAATKGMGAKVQCPYPRCCVSFHPTCALEAGQCVKLADEPNRHGLAISGRMSVLCAKHSSEERAWMRGEAADGVAPSRRKRKS